MSIKYEMSPFLFSHKMLVIFMFCSIYKFFFAQILVNVSFDLLLLLLLKKN